MTKRRVESREEFLDRVGAHKPFSEPVWAKVRRIFEAPLPPKTDRGDAA